MEDIKVDELCIENLKCKINNCTKQHYRYFAGICIQGMQQNEEDGKCGNENCKLNHKNFETIKEQISINGINKFNICPNLNKECKKQIEADCCFLHPQWEIEYCVPFLKLNKCSNTTCYCHISYKKLQQEVYRKFDINHINPENICIKTGCTCEKHLQIPDNLCILNFQGLCPLLECPKIHQTWEDYNKGFEAPVAKLQSCINIHFKHAEQTLQGDKNQKLYFHKSEKDKLKQISQEILEENVIDIVFIMDLTGSMQPWIDNCQTNIVNILDTFQTHIKVVPLRIAFVGYRDFELNQQKTIINKNHIVYHDFTEDANKIKKFISNLKAIGGGDQAEDIISGLEKVFDLNICTHPESILISFLFADAPNHGIQYHESYVNDDLSEKIEKGSLERVIQKYKQLKQKNFFSCVTINNTTEKMYEIMKQQFPDIIISQTQVPDKLTEYIKLTLIESYKKSQECAVEKQIKRNCFTIQASFTKTKYLKYKNDENEQYRKKFWKDIIQHFQKDENLRKGQTIIKIEEDQIQFEKKDDGVQSFIFRLYDTEINRNMLVKISKQYINLFKQKEGKLSNQEIEEEENLTQDRFLSQSIAKQLAFIYRQKTQNIQQAPPLFFASPIIYELNQPFYGLNKIYAESFIDLQNIDWKKYSNNTLYTEQDYYYFTSFSHFTYEETAKVLIVTDLQGKKNILSDPSIQSEFINFKDSTNIREKGIEYFKQNHKQCNQICEQLSLQQFNNNESLDQSKWNINSTDIINVICESCDQLRKISQNEYILKLYEKCQSCISKEEEKYIVQCQCCLKNDEVPYNLRLTRHTKNLYKCEKCYGQCNGILKGCIYCKISCKQFVQKYEIDSKVQYICQPGLKYLTSLRCKKCQNFYNSKILLSKEDYQTGNYCCSTCKKQSE